MPIFIAKTVSQTRYRTDCISNTVSLRLYRKHGIANTVSHRLYRKHNTDPRPRCTILYGQVKLDGDADPGHRRLFVRFGLVFQRTACILPALSLALVLVTIEDTKSQLDKSPPVHDILELVFQALVGAFSVNYLYAMAASSADASAPSRLAIPLDVCLAFGVGVQLFRGDPGKPVSQTWVVVVGAWACVLCMAFFALELWEAHIPHDHTDSIASVSNTWIRIFRVLGVSVHILLVVLFLVNQSVRSQEDYPTTRARQFEKVADKDGYAYLKPFAKDETGLDTWYVALVLLVAAAAFAAWSALQVQAVKAESPEPESDEDEGSIPMAEPDKTLPGKHALFVGGRGHTKPRHRAR